MLVQVLSGTPPTMTDGDAERLFRYGRVEQRTESGNLGLTPIGINLVLRHVGWPKAH